MADEPVHHRGAGHGLELVAMAVVAELDPGLVAAYADGLQVGGHRAEFRFRGQGLRPGHHQARDARSLMGGNAGVPPGECIGKVTAGDLLGAQGPARMGRDQFEARLVHDSLEVGRIHSIELTLVIASRFRAGKAHLDQPGEDILVILGEEFRRSDERPGRVQLHGHFLLGRLDFFGKAITYIGEAFAVGAP